jgi:cysteine desulfurase
MAYLDHAATTPLRPEALAAMLPYLTEHFGNPSGSHAVARRAKAALEDARDEVAVALGCAAREVVFTGGGTEADNLAIGGVVGRRGGRPLCPASEHHAVLHTTQALGGIVVGVGASGLVDPSRMADAVRETGDVSIVSVMLANNEVGTIQPLADIVDAVRAAGPVIVHTDAVQAFPWIDVASMAAGVDLVSVSAHKFGGPKGVGVLVAREGTPLAPLLHGGGQEADRRSGTHNLTGIVGMAAAMTAMVAARSETVRRVGALRDRLVDGLLASVPDAVETGRRSGKIAGNAHVRFPGVESESLLFLLDEAGLCASAGSACASGAIEPSHVLVAMGLSPVEAASSVRFSLGSPSTDDDVDLALKVVPDAVARLRKG